MLRDADVQAFVPTTDLDRAERFYADVLGFVVAERTPIALVIDAHGAQLRITLVAELHPQPFTVLGWRVADLDAELAALTGQGVTPLRFQGMDQDQNAVWTSPSGARVVWFADPDGNVLSLTDGG